MGSRTLAAWCAAVAALLLAAPAPAPAQTPSARASTVFPPFERLPLDPPLVVTGSFGEFRRGHFHAGLDLSTGGRVGKEVYAPLDGQVERVRTSGVGYGRSLYIRSDDGRLIVFGHLDAFEEPVASYVAAIQDSSGLYEQDLWPATGSFPVRAGQRVAWSGESGAGGPHLHVEVRRGDMALNPLMAGMPLGDPSAPRLESLTLQPLDETSRVEGGATTYTVELDAAPDTIEVRGRVRAAIVAKDAIGPGAASAEPWWLRVEFDGQTVECRFDSASWATDMSEADYVYDAGQITGDGGVVMWAPVGFRPRPFRASGAGGNAWGMLEVRPDDPPRVLRLSVGDAARNVDVREIVLAPRRRRPRAAAAKAEAERPTSVALPEWKLTSLPERRLGLRVRDRLACRFDRAILDGASQLLSGEGRRRGAVLRPNARGAVRWAFEGGATSWFGPCSAEGPTMWLSSLREGSKDRFAGLEWSVPEGALFEPVVVLAETLSRIEATAELIPVGRGYAFHPQPMALRAPIQIRLDPRGAAGEGLGLFLDTGDGWEFVRSRVDTADGRLEAETRRLGRIALFRDVTPPRIKGTHARRAATRGAYRRAALEARLEEQGSGIDAQGTYFEVDGKRVPSEWDAEARTLRWRPIGSRRGTHGYQLTARDRAGNVARGSGTFVLD